MRYYEFDLNETGTSRLYCKIVERPLSANVDPSPAFLWIPGGGFAGCAPEDGEAVIMTLCGHGCCGFTVTYPVGPDYRFPDVLVQISKAICFIRANAEEWNVDPNRIVIGGGSAGGFISGAYGAFWNHPEMQKLTGCSSGENRPNALLTQNGLFNAYQQTERGTVEVPVYDYIGRDMPPTFLLHASDDTLVSVDQTLAMAWNLSRAKVPFSMYIADSGNHTGLQYHRHTVMPAGGLSHKVDDWMPAFLLFLDNVLGVPAEYEKFSLPEPGQVGQYGEGFPPLPDMKEMPKMPDMHIGDYKDGMVWGFSEEEAAKMDWPKNI